MAGLGFVGLKPLTHEEIAQNELVAKQEAEVSAIRKVVAQYQQDHAKTRQFQDEIRLRMAALEDRIAQHEANIDEAVKARLRGLLEQI